MTIPPNFIFTQNNLEDFVDCPRRFQLKHLLKMAWPAPVSEPIEENERQIRLGSKFHQMVHQYFLGIPQEKISALCNDDDLLTWWTTFLTQLPVDLPSKRLPEIETGMPFHGFRLSAKIDLLAVEKGVSAVIVDWKTTHKPPKPDFINTRIQSLVYPFLVISTGTNLNDYQPFQPDQVKMVYWYPAFPDKPVVLSFTVDWMEKTRQVLERHVNEIIHLESDIFPLTTDEKKCQFCRYRSLCERGISAGNLNDLEEDEDEIGGEININFDEIEGIAF